MVLRRDDWLDVARKVDWTPRYVEERELFPEEISGRPWLTQDAWHGWNEAYRTTYREYVANQREKDAAVLGVRAALSKPRLFDDLDPGWVQLVKFHNGAVALAEYAGAVAELRMARFGRDSAWRTMATLGALDEIRHTQIPLLIGHDLLAHDGNFDWTHKAFHTSEWVILAARHLFDDMFLAADAIDLAIQLNFVFETGFTNLQFMAMAAMADRAHHHLFEKTVASIQTDEARHAQIGHPVLRTLLENGSRERAQYLIDKMWWRCWRLFLALSGTAMEYLAPVSARTRSFKEFMTEWVTEQFMKNLAEFDLEKPWFWDLFAEELDYAHHSFQLGLYTYRTTLWFDVAMPDARGARMAEPEVPPVGGDLRGALGPARAALGGRRRGQYAVLRAPRALQFVPAPRAVHQARAEHGVHPGAGRTPLPILLRAVPLDLRAGEVAVRGSQERGRSDRRRRGARQAHRPAQVDGTRSARRDRQGPAPRPRPVAPGPRSDGLRMPRCASTCSASRATTSWAASSSLRTSAPWRSWPASWWPGAWRPSGTDLSRCATRPATSSIPPRPSPRPGSETATSSRSSEGDGTVAVWRYAGTLDDIWAGEMRAVNLGAIDVLLCNLDGMLVAYENRCPHLANPLSEGVFDDGVLTCAAHEWEFDARTGRGLNPASACLRRYPVRLDGEKNFVGIAEDE